MRSLKWAWRGIKATPHLFAKCMVLWCVACGTGACFWSLRILSHTGQDPAALLGVILAFFGGELLLMCLKTILKEKQTSSGTADAVPPSPKGEG